MSKHNWHLVEHIISEPADVPMTNKATNKYKFVCSDCGLVKILDAKSIEE